jgi:hypothetical protein
MRLMSSKHPKSVRRRLLQILHRHYCANPLVMLTPEELLSDGTVKRADLMPNVHYLHDRGLVELMTAYAPPMFAGVRLKADGVDLVENHFEFNRRFPPTLSELEEEHDQVPSLLEELIEQADLTQLDGENRKRLQHDIDYLRDEVARPVERWRPEVIQVVLGWVEGYFDELDVFEELPSLAPLREALGAVIGGGMWPPGSGSHGPH